MRRDRNPAIISGPGQGSSGPSICSVCWYLGGAGLEGQRLDVFPVEEIKKSVLGTDQQIEFAVDVEIRNNQIRLPRTEPFRPVKQG